MSINLCDIPCFHLIAMIRDDSNVPIVVLSRDNNVNTLVRAFDAGASDYIVKPFYKSVFIARLQSLVRRRTWDMQSIDKGQQEKTVKE